MCVCVCVCVDACTSVCKLGFMSMMVSMCFGERAQHTKTAQPRENQYPCGNSTFCTKEDEN